MCSHVPNKGEQMVRYYGLWDLIARPPPTAHIDYSRRGVSPYGPEADSQVPPCEDYLNCDPDYPIETYAS